MNVRRTTLFACLLLALAACAPAPATSPAPEPTAVPTATAFQPAAPTATAEPGPEYTTSVLLGLDYDPARPERNQYGVRTDVFVVATLVTYPPEWNQPPRLLLVSLPRDLYLPIACAREEGESEVIPLPGRFADDQPYDQLPRETFDRINAAYYKGGPDCVRETVRYNLGIEVDGPVAWMEMPKFAEAAEYLGGLDITPGQEYVDFCGFYLGTDGDGGDWRHWRAGITRHLNGNEVLCYIRGRRTPDGDLDRNRRTLEVLLAAREQWAPERVSLQEAGNLLAWALTYVHVDPALGAAPWLFEHYQDLQDADIETQRLPLGQGVKFYTTPGGASVVVPDFTESDPAAGLRHWFACTLAQC